MSTAATSGYPTTRPSSTQWASMSPVWPTQTAIESFWAALKRGYRGTYHHMSVKHLGRYVGEFEGRHNDRPADTVDQMGHMVKGMEGKRLRYQDLVADTRSLDC